MIVALPEDETTFRVVRRSWASRYWLARHIRTATDVEQEEAIFNCLKIRLHLLVFSSVGFCYVSASYCNKSLNAKIDELQVVAQQNHVDVIAITETWLNPEIPDGPVSLTDFSIVRDDRASGKRGGGVCAFIKSGIPFSTLTDLCVSEIECVWLKLRPHRLPRELACILVGVYLPSSIG